MKKQILSFWSFLLAGSVLLAGNVLTAQEFLLEQTKSLAEVRDAVRTWHSANPGKTATVKVAPGEYFLEEAFTLTPEDSYTIFEAQDARKKPVFTRGKEIRGWKKMENGWFVTQIEEVKNGTFWFETLYVNGRRAIHARTPNADVPDGRRCFYLWDTSAENPSTQFFHRPEQKEIFAEIAAMPNPQDVKIQCFHSWESSLHRIADVDTEKALVTLTGGPRWKLNYWGPNLRYHIEGVESALDQPGEFLLKRDGTCIYIPQEGETPENVRFLAPVGPKTFEEAGFLRISGTPAADGKDAVRAKEIHFRNLVFSCDVWNLPPQGLSDGQSAVSSPISILANHAENVTFRECEVRNVGGYAFHFLEGCQKCAVEKCLMEDLGAGGVRIGPGHGTQLSPELRTSEITVKNCIIRGYGRLDAGGIGVWIGHSPQNTVLHNDISDGFYTGVSVGWVWGYRESIAKENCIEFNHIHDIGHGVLSDMGGVYSLGISDGTSVSNNHIHHVFSYNRYGRGGWGLYTDEGSSNIRLENNLVYRTHTGNFHQHYGKENLIRNNILAFSREEQVKRSRPEQHLSFSMEQNIILFDSSEEGQHLLLGNWKNEFTNMKRNLYWDYGSGKAYDFAGMTFEEWQAIGKDKDGIIADPCFVDAKGGDFRFTEASKPILEKIGFQPFDFTKAGILKDDPEWTAELKNWKYPKVILMPDAPAPRPFEVTDDFESPRSTPVPKVRNLSGTSGSYQVLEENGNHFLRITDTPNQQFPFNPHFTYPANFRENGIAKIAFDVRLSEKAHLMAEARDHSFAQYRVGVPLRIRASEISCQGKLCANAPNSWTRIELEVPVGPNRAETYLLKVTPRGGETQTFTLPISSKDWKGLDAFVFAALENVDAWIDLDNVRFELQDK